MLSSPSSYSSRLSRFTIFLYLILFEKFKSHHHHYHHSYNSRIVIFAVATANSPTATSGLSSHHRRHYPHLHFAFQQLTNTRLSRTKGIKETIYTAMLARRGDDSCSVHHHDSMTTTTTNHNHNKNNKNRREFFQQIILSTGATSFFWTTTTIGTTRPPTAMAYEPDPNPLRESLYLISRVQEATVQQERFVRNATNQQDLKNKMKLTLLLIQKNYKLVDQIIYCSSYIPSEHLVEATQAGNIAAEELQSAIDYVRNDLSSGPLDVKQKEYIINALTTTREELCIFVDLLPQDDLEAARARIEKENQWNMEEFDGDESAGVYNPVVLPWKQK
mmetsp:Transcript_12692/g.23788  ORF Transcript_12692/g.23788 Transcript_12692/m.23788 type:complete len:332 (-) Transcript_12692:50-1045(-)